MHHPGQGEPGGRPHLGEGNHAEEHGNHIAAEHADEDGGQLADALSVVVQQHDDGQGQRGHQPVLPGAVDQGLRLAPGFHHQLICIGGSSRHVVDSRGVEGKADGKDHRAGNHRRKQEADFLHEHAHHDGDDSTHDHGPGHGPHAAPGGGDGLHAGHVGKADAHDHRQAGAEILIHRVKLDEGAHGGHHQGRLNQQYLIRRAEADGPGDDDGRRDAAHNHGDKVLKGQGDGGPKRGNASNLEQRLLAGGGCHGGVLLPVSSVLMDGGP